MNGYLIQMPFSHSDINKIEQIIRKKDIIRFVYSDHSFDQYSIRAYLEKEYVHNSKFGAIFDRNIFSNIIEVARNGGNKKITATQKAACALLAFFQISEVAIEPNMAFYEYTDSGHYEKSLDQLSLFRAIDNLNPQMLIDIALGRRNIVPPEMLHVKVDESVAKKKGEQLRHWKMYYGCILKLACIETIGGKSVDKLKCFLEWMHNEYIFLYIPLVFALIFFSNKRFPGMIKDLNGQKKEKILRGLRNATWDIMVAHLWSKKTTERESGLFWLLCTEDNALKKIVKYLALTYDSPEELEQFLKALFREYLGDKQWKQVYQMHINFEKNRDDRSRKINNMEPSKDLYADIDRLEEELLSKLIPKGN